MEATLVAGLALHDTFQLWLMCQLKVPDLIHPKSPFKSALSYSAVFTSHTLKVFLTSG